MTVTRDILTVVIAALIGWWTMEALTSDETFVASDAPPTGLRSLLDGGRAFRLNISQLETISDPLERLLWLDRHLENASSGEVRRLLEELEKRPRADWPGVRHCLLERFVELAPEEALRYALQPGLGGDIYSVALYWAHRDLEAAFEAVRNITRPISRSQVQDVLAHDLARTRPWEVANLMEDDWNHYIDSIHLGYLFTALAADDPAEAAKLALSIPNQLRSHQALSTTLLQWVRKDPQEALRWVTAIEDRAARQNGLNRLVTAWATEDLPAAYEYARSNQALTEARLQPFSKGTRFGWPSMTPAEAVDWVEENVGTANYRESFLLGIIDFFKHESPGEVADLLLDLTDQKEAGNAAHDLVTNWASRDFEAARRWAMELQDETLRHQALDGLVGHLADHDPEAALEMLASTVDAPPKLSRQTVGSLAENLNAIGLPMETWIEALPEGARGTIMMNGIGEMLGEGMDPELVWKKIETFSSDDLRPSFQGRLIGLTSAVDLEKAIALWDQLPGDHPFHVGGARSIVGNWAASDPAAAEAWARTVPDATIRDAAMAQLVETAGRFQPTQALAWASSIGDETLRAGAVKRALITLSYTDPQRALAELQRFELPAETRESLEVSLREQLLWQTSASNPAR